MDEVITISSDDEKFERNINEDDLINDENVPTSTSLFSNNFENKRNKPRPKREYIYEAIERNTSLEKEIEHIR